MAKYQAKLTSKMSWPRQTTQEILSD